MRMMMGITRWMASHHRTEYLRVRAHHAPKGRVIRKVAVRSVTRSQRGGLGGTMRDV